MLFVLIGIALIGLNLANVAPFGAWNWEFFGDMWRFLVPFALAFAWWVWSDKSGLNKRREMDRMEKKKSERRKENLVSLGMDHNNARKRAQQKR